MTLRDTDADAFISAMIECAEMEETGEYLTRGRAHAKLSDDDLRAAWAKGFRRWFCLRGLPEARDANDLAAEMRLRKLVLPYERIREESDAMAREIKQEGARSPEIREKIKKFRADMRRRKN